MKTHGSAEPLLGLYLVGTALGTAVNLEPLDDELALTAAKVASERPR